MHKQKILVTGGTGFIGSHTVVALLDAGYDVTIIDNLSNSFIEVLDRIEKITSIRPKFYNIDLTNRNATRSFIEANSNFDGVIHCAAYKAVGESVHSPLKYYINNLGSLTILLENMAIKGIKNLVFSSSCTVYGEPDKLPITENSPIKKAESPYGSTKIMSETIIEDAVK